MTDTSNDPELEQLVARIRANAPPPNRTLPEIRKGFEDMFCAFPVAEDLACAPVQLNGVSALRVTAPAARAGTALLYLHGGGYALGNSQTHRGLAGEIARSAQATAYVPDYRRAPERPLPAAIEDGLNAYRGLLDLGLAPGAIALAGDSAGGGLAVAVLVAARDAGLPMPAAAALISPWADLECAGGTMTSNAADDPILNAVALQAMAGLYVGTASRRDPRASPIHAALGGLPPLLIQVGSAELLLDDAIRLAAAAGAADVPVRLAIWPRMIHVWHVHAAVLTAARRAIVEAGTFLQSHLAGKSP